MIRKYTFVIPFQLPWDWSADYQRQTCLELAKKYKVIAYMKRDRKFFIKGLFNPTQKYPYHPNILFYIPYDFIPFQRFNFIRELNDFISFKFMEIFYMNPKSKYLWIFDPIFHPLVNLFRGPSLYDCVDLISSPDKKLLGFIKSCEELLIRKVDYFFVNSLVLNDKHKYLRIPNVVLPQGFNVDAYANTSQQTQTFPKDKPIIGFVGGLNQRLDYSLMHNLIKRNRQWTFVLWGPLQDNTPKDSAKTAAEFKKLSKYANFITGKSVNRDEVPGIVRQFDIGIIPYDVSQDFNKYCYPMKLFEYFYFSKPVVATPIQELKRFPNYVKLATDTLSWEENIRYWLQNPLNTHQQKDIKKIAIDNSWANKVGEIIHKLGVSDSKSQI